MNRDDLDYQGPPIDDPETLARLPNELRALLEERNGFVQYGGGLHVRGACLAPEWHALRVVWSGDLALHRRYPAVSESDIPFGQDAVGDQFLLRDGLVIHLLAETGDVQPMNCTLMEFLERATADPLEVLGLHPLLQFQRDGGHLQPGQLLNVFPPFCTTESAAGVSLSAVPALERLGFLAEFAAQTARLPDGQKIKIAFVDEPARPPQKRPWWQF